MPQLLQERSVYLCPRQPFGSKAGEVLDGTYPFVGLAGCLQALLFCTFRLRTVCLGAFLPTFF